MFVTTMVSAQQYFGADATILLISERWKLRPTEVKYITQTQ